LPTAACCATAWTTTRGVGQSATGIKLLFAYAKREFLATVATGEDTVLVSFIGMHG
jgi:hypothetical protein